MKISQKIAAAAVSAVIVVGGTTTAFAAGDGSGGTGKADKIAVLCAHKDEIVPTLTKRQSELTERIAVLKVLDTKATTAGRTKVAARLEQRIAKLQDRLDKVSTRLEKAPAWIAANCPAA